MQLILWFFKQNHKLWKKDIGQVGVLVGVATLKRRDPLGCFVFEYKKHINHFNQKTIFIYK